MVRGLETRLSKYLACGRGSWVFFGLSKVHSRTLSINKSPSRCLSHQSELGTNYKKRLKEDIDVRVRSLIGNVFLVRVGKIADFGLTLRKGFWEAGRTPPPNFSETTPWAVGQSWSTSPAVGQCQLLEKI